MNSNRKSVNWKAEGVAALNPIRSEQLNPDLCHRYKSPNYKQPGSAWKIGEHCHKDYYEEVGYE